MTAKVDVAELVSLYHDHESDTVVLTFEKEKTCVELTVKADNLIDHVMQTGWFDE